MATAAENAPLVIPLDELGLGSLPLAGGKAAQLGALIHAGLPVPGGFCVTTTAYRRGLDEALRAEIAAAYEAMDAGLVAVRSSATAEDLPDASFAGQQETFLNVEGREAVLDAVARCWESLFTERAVAYRRDRNIADDDVAMAVVVQRMVPAAAAGVLFTVNPVTGAHDEMVVEAARGLGDQVVSARVTPARYRVRRRAPHEVMEREGESEGEILSAAHLAELAELGLRAERMLGRAADIEWALDSEQLWLLQARSVTAVGGQGPAVEFGSRWNEEACRGRLLFWSNHNVRETMPYPHTPFSWSLWKQLLLPMMLRAMGFYGSREMHQLEALPAGMDLIEGRIYWNLNVCAGLFTPRLFHAMTVHVDTEVADFLKKAMASGELQPIYAPLGMRLRMWARFLFACTRVLRRTPEQAWRSLRHAAREVEEFRRMPLERLTDQHILALARYFCYENLPRSNEALFAAVSSLPAVEYLARALPRWGFPDTFARLLAGCGNPTMDTALALWDVAAAAPEEVRRTFAAEPIAAVPGALAQSDPGRAFLARVQAFLEQHGHRAAREFDFACPRWRDDPTFVYETLRNYLAHPADQPTPAEHYAGLQRGRVELKAQVEAGLARRPWRRWLFRKLMHMVETRQPLREAPKFYGMMGLAHVRDLYLEVARRLVERGTLAAVDDFYFLTLGELEEFAAGRGDPAAVTAQIPERRREFARQLRANPALIVRSDGRPVVTTVATGDVLRGTPVSWGSVRGKVRVLLDPADGAQLHAGEILVAPFTDPGWTPLFLTAGGLVMEVGGIMSHGAVVAREYGIPAVVGVKEATRQLHDGELVEVNGATGEVRRVAAS